VVPQNPLSLSRSECIEYAKAQPLDGGEGNGPLQLGRRFWMEVAGGSAIDRPAREVVRPGIGEINLDPEYLGSDFDKVHLDPKLPQVVNYRTIGSITNGAGGERPPAARKVEDRVKTLALDCATACCSVALLSDGVIAAGQAATMARGHAEALMPMVETVLSDAGTAYCDLDLVAVTVGPGAFTGLRIGLAAARGIVLAAKLPIIGVTTLEALAYRRAAGEPVTATVMAVLDTKRGDFYAQVFGADGAPLCEPQVATGDALSGLVSVGPVLVVGDGAEAASDYLRAAGIAATVADAARHPDAASVATIARGRWQPGITPTTPAPLYLRAALTSLPKINRPAAGSTVAGS
jgi:tRNA threonylcarbamoyladenosine biosynthesis protein TsaB